MEEIITSSNLHYFAYVNHKVCTKPVRGIAIDFFGLGCQQTFDTDTDTGVFFGQKGILYVIPYLNPWAWMNEHAVNTVNRILNVVKQAYCPKSVPVVTMGGSMGGQSALCYTAHGTHKPVACVTNCPVCDVVFHYTERPDLPRTLCSAVGQGQGSLTHKLARISPLHLVDTLPAIPYVIYHCDKDMAVNLDKHSRMFVAEMQKSGHRIALHVVPDRGHCDLPPDVKLDYLDTVANFVLNNA